MKHFQEVALGSKDPMDCIRFHGLKLLDFLLPSVFCLFASFGPCFGLQLCEAATSIKSGSSRKTIKPHNPVIMKETIFYLQRYFRSSRGEIST
jgi:hypothetical protein